MLSKYERTNAKDATAIMYRAKWEVFGSSLGWSKV